MNKLRDFVYIDDISLNSNLSSLGKGVPAEIIRSTEDETQKSGEGSAKAFNIGIKGGISGLDRDSTETTLDITAPYRVQDLMNALDDFGIEIKENPDPRSLSRGDVVRIEGEAKPMSLFKMEVALEKIFEFMDAETVDLLPDRHAPSEDIDFEELNDFFNFMGKLTGGEVPLRMVTSEDDFGVALDRKHMRKAPSRAFLDEKKYVLFGRVDHRIPRNSNWNPILALNIMERYFPELDQSDELESSLKSFARSFRIPMEKVDWRLPGRVAIIHPIAMFW